MAIKNREEALRDDFHLDSGTYGYDDEEEEWGDDDTNWNAEEEDEKETTETKDESTAYLEFLNEEAQKFRSAGDAAEYSEEDLGEDSVLLESPLDKIDPYTTFKVSLMKLQQEQPQFYASLTAHLTADERNVIHAVCEQAEAFSQQQAAQGVAPPANGAS